MRRRKRTPYCRLLPLFRMHARGRLDKACIDQNDVDSDLRCLPVFLAGCNSLLILAGETYSERLWCLIEVYVFLQMGGDVRHS